MQLSSDEAVKYISSAHGRARDSERDWYRINVTDSEGSIIQLYAEPEAYSKVGHLQTGDPMGIVVRARQGSKGISLSVTDIILG